MKTLLTVLAVLLVIVALLVVGLQMFLTKGLTTALNQGVFPAVESMYGLKMDIENASVNLLKGRADLDGFSVTNLKGYTEPHLLTFDNCQLELDLMSLLNRDPVVIKNVEATGAVLVVERNKEKKINVKELADALKPVESAEDPAGAPGEPEPEAEKKEPVPVHIKNLAVVTTVSYVDSGRDRDYALNLHLTGTDLFTVPKEGQPDSLISLRGAMEEDEGSAVTELDAILKPLTDPKNPTFSVSGSILDIDADFIKELLDKNDMKSGPFSVKPSITCKKGALAGSYLDLILTSLEIYGASIGEAKVTVPVTGTLQKPSIDLYGSLGSLFSEQALNIGAAVGLGELKKELSIEPGATPQEMLMGQLTNRVDEVAESPALQELLGQVLPGAQPTNTAVTNKPAKESVEDALIEKLEENVKELKGNEAVKDLIRGLF